MTRISKIAGMVECARTLVQMSAGSWRQDFDDHDRIGICCGGTLGWAGDGNVRHAVVEPSPHIGDHPRIRPITWGSAGRGHCSTGV